MATLAEKIHSDLNKAIKEKQQIIVETLRMLFSNMHNKEIEKKGKGIEPTLTDEEVIEVISKEVKKRKEAATLYTQGGRADLAEKEKSELSVLEVYLPAQMSADDVLKHVQVVVKRMRDSGEGQFGKIMGEAMKELKGKADAKLVGDMVKRCMEE